MAKGLQDIEIYEPTPFFDVPDTFSVSYYETGSGSHGGAFEIIQLTDSGWKILERYGIDYCSTIEQSNATESDRAFYDYTDHCR